MTEHSKRIDIKALIISLCLLLGLFILDQLTKTEALRYLAFGESVELYTSKPLSLFFTLVTNTGAAWGTFAFSPKILFAVRTCIVIILSILWGKVPQLATKLYIVTIIAGALSNMLDFILYGAVIDFIHLRFWEYNYPIFNVADITIFVGTIGLMWKLYKK